MAPSCGCLRVEDLDTLRSFITAIANIEKDTRKMEIRERAHIEEQDLPAEAKEEQLMELAVAMKKMEREGKLEEYRRFIEHYPHLCEAASGYLK